MNSFFQPVSYKDSDPTAMRRRIIRLDWINFERFEDWTVCGAAD